MSAAGGRLARWRSRSAREWLWVARRRLTPCRPYPVPFDGDLQIEVCPGDELALHYALGREFEEDVCAFFRWFLRPGMVVLDLGANIGQYTLLAAKRVGDQGRVYAFEPATAEYRKLAANVARNRFRNVVIEKRAVGAEPGTALLHTCADGYGLYHSLGSPIRGGRGASEEVPVTTLDVFAAERELERVDLVKMDIEGAELAALRGGRDLFSRTDAPVIVCEFSEPAARGMGHSTRELRALLEEYGYRLYRWETASGRLAEEPRHDMYEYANLVATRRNLDLR